MGQTSGLPVTKPPVSWTDCQHASRGCLNRQTGGLPHLGARHPVLNVPTGALSIWVSDRGEVSLALDGLRPKRSDGFDLNMKTVFTNKWRRTVGNPVFALSFIAALTAITVLAKETPRVTFSDRTIDRSVRGA